MPVMTYSDAYSHTNFTTNVTKHNNSNRAKTLKKKGNAIVLKFSRHVTSCLRQLSTHHIRSCFISLLGNTNFGRHVNYRVGKHL